MAKRRDAALKSVSLWEYEPEAEASERFSKVQPKHVSEIDPATNRYRAASEVVAADVVDFYGGPDGIDPNLTPRAFVVLAVVGAVSQTTWITVGDIQIDIERREAETIPMATLYPLVERLATTGFLDKKLERGSPGRPKALFRISHLGYRALALAKSIADNCREQGRPKKR